MALLYKLHKIVRTYKDGRTDKANNHWFARALSVGTLETDDIAEIIQRNCSMKKSDVKAVIEELVEVITDKMQESYAVKINGLGTFRIGIQSVGAETVADFSATTNIVGARVNFQPYFTIDNVTGKRNTPMLKGITYKETAKNDVVKE